ncbi:MAG: peptide ABC transporter substrate-binding protein [Alphaproteobacteria bacterium]
MRLSNKISALALILALPLLAACGDSSSAEKDETGQESPLRTSLTIGMTQFPSTLHPLIDSMLAKSYVHGFTRRPITAFGHDWTVQCLLCEALPSYADGTIKQVTRDDGTEALDVTYTLDARAKWGDGTPITTKDVLFTWEVGKHPETGVSNAELFAEDITNITVHDDRSFTLHLDKVVCNAEGINDFELIPAHIDRAAFDKGAREYRNQTAYVTDPTNPGLWSGPYRLAEQQTGAWLKLTRNTQWWGDAPQFDDITIRVIEDTTALTANLRAGDVDMIAGGLGLTADQGLAFEERHGKDWQIIWEDGLIYEHIDMNLDDPWLADQRVRKALIHALDRDTLVEQLFKGRQKVAHANIHFLDSVYNDDVTKYGHDPVKAAELLDQAGWSLRQDGKRVNAKGEVLRLRFGTTAGNRSRELVQQFLQDNWSKVGVEVEIANQTPRVFFGDTMNERKFGHMAMYAWIAAPQNIPRTTLHSTMIPTEENNWAGQNYPGYVSDETDKILDDLETVCEQPARQQLWDRLQVKYAEDLPVIPLYFRANPHILPKWLTGLRPTGHLDPASLWVTEWKQRETADKD